MRSAIATATRISKTSLTSVDWRNLQGRHRSVVRLPLADPGTMYTAVLNRAAGSRTQYAILRLKHEHLLHTALLKTLKSFLNHHHPSKHRLRAGIGKSLLNSDSHETCLSI